MIYADTEKYGKIGISFTHYRKDVDGYGNKIKKNRNSPSTTSTTTECRLSVKNPRWTINTTNQPEYLYYTGVSRLNPKDQFKKWLGREFALIRALASWEHLDEKTANIILSAYRNRDKTSKKYNFADNSPFFNGDFNYGIGYGILRFIGD